MPMELVGAAGPVLEAVAPAVPVAAARLVLVLVLVLVLPAQSS